VLPHVFRIVNHEIATLNPSVTVQGIVAFAHADVDLCIDAPQSQKPAQGNRPPQAPQWQRASSCNGREKMYIDADLFRAALRHRFTDRCEELNAGKQALEPEHSEPCIRHWQNQSGP
jgi:hypothetical protein